MTRLLNGYCQLLNLLMAAALAVMVVLVFGNVVLRYAFNSGIALSEEVSRWLFLWLTFLGAVVALHQHSHLGTDLLVARLSPAGQKSCQVLAQIAMLFVTWLMLKGSWAQAVINFDVQAPVTGASVAVFYATGVFFGISGLLILGWQLLRSMTRNLDAAELVMVQDAEDSKQLKVMRLNRNSDKPSGR